VDFGVIVLAVLAVPVCAIAAFAMVLRLRGRVELLEARLAAAEGELRAAALRPPPPAPAPFEATAAGPEREPEPQPVPEFVPEPEALERPAAPEPRTVPPISAPNAEVPPSGSAAAAAPPSREFEEQLGTRWAVWIGGLALALGGVFLVRYSIEQGLLGPGARVAAGALFALALIGAGEWIRRRDIALSVPGLPSAHIPSVLTAAGTLTAFATAYAAHALYGLIGPATTFVLLGVISILTVVAATLHGPALAGLGLVASLASPLLVSSGQPRYWPVVLYLAFAVGAAYGVARLRLWRWLAVAAAVGAMLWSVLFLLDSADILPTMAHVLAQFGLAGLFLVADPHRGTPDREARPDPLAALVLLGFAVLAVLVTDATEIGEVRPFFAGAVAAAMLALAVRFPAAGAAAAWAGLVTIGTLLLWPVDREIAAEPLRVYPPFGVTTPEALRTFLAVATILAGAVGVLTIRRLARGRELPLATGGWLAAAGVITPLLVLVVAYGRVTALGRDLPFALAAGALALAFAAAARWLWQGMGPALDAVRLAVGATAAGALAALGLGLTFALDKGMLTVAFALMAPGTAWVAARVGLPVLRYAVAAIGLLVLARLIWDPTIGGPDPGSLPILNWLLWGYGVPALAFLVAARLLERGGRDRVTRFAESLAIAFAAFLVFFEIRHAVHGDIAEGATDHLEAGLMTTSAIAFSIVMVRADSRSPDPVYAAASTIFSALSFAGAVFGLLTATNPFFSFDPVRGGPILNSLLAAYLLPAALAAILALVARRSRPREYVWVAAAGALVLHLAYMLLEIRRIFHGPEIGWDLPTGEGEQWTYSLALLACGLVVLGLGIVRRSRFLRLASAVYLGLAVLKVFIVDLSNLEGIMRALSFIGLGATLIGIALVYQRVLARRPDAAGPA
jgi:uncharacterized membrane protein